MPQAFTWNEGSVYIWTGNASPSTSAVIAYAANMRAPFEIGWDNRANASGSYYDHKTGQRCNLTIGAVHTVDSTIMKIFQSATAVHMKLLHSNLAGSAGVLLYSGRIDNLQYAGSERSPYSYTLAAHFNAWSAF